MDFPYSDNQRLNICCSSSMNKIHCIYFMFLPLINSAKLATKISNIPHLNETALAIRIVSQLVLSHELEYGKQVFILCQQTGKPHKQ